MRATELRCGCGMIRERDGKPTEADADLRAKLEAAEGRIERARELVDLISDYIAESGEVADPLDANILLENAQVMAQEVLTVLSSEPRSAGTDAPSAEAGPA